ncbi:TRAP transporter substrate-binding protein DctP [Pleomorphochaeta sp. DL1XJH-081]|jgi:C4-dicarboxylate-binding protein DctP|uniref:TRAP transporter substrate-binding protein DctP n=1 Tax=Pleomorphochaeta sp. DL1XJH-081 TaxID=3409690 RepID=UPI003BB5F612
MYGKDAKNRKFYVRNIVLIIGIFLCIPLEAKTLPIIRISVENTASHVQAKAVQLFSDKLEDKLSGRYEIQFFPAASLFRDTDIFRALAQGKVEIAVPGSWQFDRYVPEVGLFLLPSMYGRDASFTYGLMESPIGDRLISTIERVLDVKVLGRWIDLGHTHIFSTTNAIKRPSDFLGKQIRVAGGVGNSLRIEALGAQPITIAWSDFPNALDRGTVDGVLTSYETLASARLWERGITSVYEDRQYFAQYIPIASGLFWDRLDSATQSIILDAWDEVVDTARRNATIAQNSARLAMMRNGLTVTVVGAGQLEKTRQTLQLHEDGIARQMGIASDLYRDFTTYIQQNDSAGGANYE